MMSFYIRLKKTKKPTQLRLRSYPDVAGTFQAIRSGKFAPLVNLRDDDIDIDSIIYTYNTAVTDTISEILGKERRRKKPWVTRDVLDLL